VIEDCTEWDSKAESTTPIGLNVNRTRTSSNITPKTPIHWNKRSGFSPCSGAGDLGPNDYRNMFIHTLTTSNCNRVNSGITGLRIKTKSVSSVRTPMSSVSFQQEEEIIEEEVVLCDDVIRNILLFLDLPSVLSFRLVNSESCFLSTYNHQYWQTVSSQRFDKMIAPSASAFQELIYLFQMHRRNVERCNQNLKRLSIVEPFQKLNRVTYGVLCPSLFAMGLTFVSVVWPLLMDGTIQSTQHMIRMLFIPVALLVLLPYMIMVICLTVDAFVFHPLKSSLIESGLPKGVKKDSLFLEKNNVRDVRARHVITMGVWALCGIPIQITAFFIRYMANFSSTSAFCIPQYLITLMFIALPMMNHVSVYLQASRNKERTEKRKIYGLMIFVHLLGVIFNLCFALQIGLLCAQIDGLMPPNTAWLALFAPSWAFCTALFFSTIGYSIILWGRGKRSLTSISIFLALIVMAFMFVFVSLGTILLGLRLDGILASAYFITSIPIFFGVMISVPVALMFSITCCMFSFNQKFYF